MPHLHLRTSSNLVENVDVPDILEALAALVSRFDTIDSKAVKVYHTLHSNWVMGEGAAPGFIHLEFSLLAGRPTELIGSMGEALQREVERLFSTSIESGEASATVRIDEMEAALYWKRS